MPDELKLCICPSCQNTAWNTCPQKQAECNYDMLQCGHAELEAENAKLKARVEAAEYFISVLTTYGEFQVTDELISEPRAAWRALR